MTKPAHVPKRAYDVAVSLLETAPDEWRTYLCAGGYLTPTGIRVDNYWRGNVCHAHVQRRDKHPLFFDTHKETKAKAEDKEANLAFCEWIMTASPVRNFILNDTVESLFHGGAIIDTFCGGSALLWICKSFRCMYEDQWRIPNWYRLTQQGVHPMFAWLVAQITTRNWVSHYRTHNAVMTPPTCEEHMRCLFIDHLPAVPTRCTEGDRWDTEEVFKFKYGGGDFPPLPLADRNGMRRVPDGWGGHILVPAGLNSNDLAKQLIVIQKEYLDG